MDYVIGNKNMTKLCSYWHQDKEKDLKRQKDIENDGWKVIKYVDRIPTLEELKEGCKWIM